MTDQFNLAVVHGDNRNNHLLMSSTRHSDVITALLGDRGVPYSDGQEIGWMAGIDEAGRGPVLGPMVYCICAAPAGDQAIQALKDCGCADSKVLSERQREAVFAHICDKVVWVAKVLSPVYLSREMLRPTKVSLNAISHDAARELTDIVSTQLQQQQDGNHSLKQLFVDTVGPPEKYQQKLKDFFPQIDVTVSKKADSIFVAVSAASIIAKLIRDAVLKSWRFEAALNMLPMSLAATSDFSSQALAGKKRTVHELVQEAESTAITEDKSVVNTRSSVKRQKSTASNSNAAVVAEHDEELPSLPDASADDIDIDEDMPTNDESTSTLSYGSGYPGDPKTKRFLAANCDPVFGFSRLVRFSWQTAQTLMLNSKGGAVLSWPDDLPEDQSWKPSTKNPQAGAMDKFIKKSMPQLGGDKKRIVVWRDAVHYREKQLSLLTWPA